jgi:hypothetical protein
VLLAAARERLDEGIREFWDSLGFALAASYTRYSLIFLMMRSWRPRSRQFCALALLMKTSCPF